MRLSKFHSAFMLALAIAGFSLARPALAQVTGGLQGQATLQNGQPCAKCMVQIERLDVHNVYKVKTDKKGNYTYIGLPVGMYKVTLLDPEGKKLFYLNNVNVNVGDPTPLNLDLSKEMKQETQKNPEAAKQQAEAEKEQKKFTGLKKYFEEGSQADAAKNYQAAIEAYQKALPLANGKNLAVILSRLGESYENAHQYDQAIATFQKVLAADPNDAQTYDDLASTYAAMGKSADAQKAYEKAASLDPAHAAVNYYNLGVTLYNQGQMDQAAAAFKKVIALDPKYADAYFYEGQAMLGKATTDKNGKIVAAPGTVEAYQQYLKLAPNGANAAVAQQMIQTLKGSVSTQYQKKKRGKS